MMNGVTKTLHRVKEEMQEFMDKDTILLGHSLENDLKGLMMIHKRVIDISILFSSKTGRRHSLRDLAYSYVKVTIQEVDNIYKKNHDSIEDARAALAVYKFKSEVLDRHRLNLEGSDFSLIKTLSNKFNDRITLISQTGEINGFEKFNFKTVELKENTVEPVIDCIIQAIKKKDSLVIGKIDFLQPCLFKQDSEYKYFIQNSCPSDE